MKRACAYPSALIAAALLFLSAPGSACAAGSISGRCFSDANKNHRLDSGEQGIAGIAVTLYKRNLILFKQQVATGTTDSEGSFSFPGLESGSYVVKAGLAPAYGATTFNPRWVLLGSSDKAVNFGLVRQLRHITITGKAYLSPSQGGSVSPAQGATITVTTDVDGNGRIGLRERATAKADSAGRYTILAPVGAGLQSVVKFSLDGYAPLLKTVRVNALQNIAGFDGTLAAMDELSDAKNGKWRNQSGTVEVSSPEVAGGSVHIFNPATDADKFPGSFSDSGGNMLVSGVFTAFNLQDESGNPLTETGGNPARIRMRMPRDTWGSVVDIAPGTSRIEVPMYYFDEQTGQWVRGKTEQGADLTGWLEQDSGDVIAESQLPAIRSGAFAGQIYAASDVTHFSYWNVDWPISSHACMSGTLRDAAGNPLPGATLNVQGLTYTGSSDSQTTGEDGAFCFDVMRSEAPGEDVNQNGVTGEAQKVLITGSSGGKLYKFGEYAVPVQSGSCPLNCLALDLQATPDKIAQVSLCSLSGTAFVEGAPKSGISVFAYDDMVDPEVWASVCGNSGCTFYAYTDDSGTFDITSPYALKLSLMGYYTEETDSPKGMFFYSANSVLTGCPANVNLDLEMLFCTVSQPAISYAGGIISLDPPAPLTALTVIGPMGIKWTIAAANEDAGFSASSVTYGSTPAGAMQAWPLLNAPPQPITPGDMIMVVPLGGTIKYNGRQCYSDSMYIVQ
jgi:hypothetical protein